MKDKLLMVSTISGACLLLGCQTHAHDSSSSNVTKLKQLSSQTDEIMLIQRLPLEQLQLPSPHTDEVSNGIKSHYEPARINILPVTFENVRRTDSKIRGANFLIDEEFLVISGLGEPQVGKHGGGEATLDLDELVDLQEAIAYMKDMVKQWQAKAPVVSTSVRFISKDGFTLETGANAYVEREDSRITFTPGVQMSA